MELRRTLEELHTLYDLEPELRDLYVEGTSDTCFFRWYLSSSGVTGIGVYPVDVLDIPAAVVSKHSLPEGSNKGRLIALSYELADSPASGRVMCIADRDFDASCGHTHTNACLSWTDGNCLELYALSPTVFRKFVLVALGGFAVSAEQLLSQCIAVLERIYAMRSANEVLKWGMSWVPFRRYVTVAGSSIQLREEALTRAYLQKNGRWPDREFFIAKVGEIVASLDDDPMRKTRGHDLSELLYTIVNQLCKEKRFGNPETLESCLLATVEVSELGTHELFKTLQAFCYGQSSDSDGEQSL